MKVVAMGTDLEKKKAWLAGYHLNGREIERLRDELARWRSLAEYGGGSLIIAGGHGSGHGNPMAEAVEHIIELEEELAGQMERRVRLRRRMERVVARVEDDGLQQLLRLRYIDGLGWELIAEQLCYSLRQVTRLHTQALQMVETRGG